MTGAIIASAAIAATASVASAVATNSANKSNVANTNQANQQQTDKVNAANAELANKQNDWNIDTWNRTNEYNKPVNEVARMKQAGLNPNMYGGNGNATVIESSSLANQQVGNPAVAAQNIDPISTAMPNLFEAINTLTSHQKTKSDIAVNYKNMDFTDQQIKVLKSQNLQINQQIKQGQLDYKKTIEEINNLRQQGQLNEQELRKNVILLDDLQVALDTHKVDYMASVENLRHLQQQTGINEATLKQMAVSLQNTIKQGKLLNQEIKFNDDSQEYRLQIIRDESGNVSITHAENEKRHALTGRRGYQVLRAGLELIGIVLGGANSGTASIARFMK